MLNGKKVTNTGTNFLGFGLTRQGSNPWFTAMEASLLPLQHRSSLHLINTTGRLIIVFAAQLFCDPRNRQNNIKSGFSFMNWLLVIIVYRKCKQYWIWTCWSLQVIVMGVHEIWPISISLFFLINFICSPIKF